MATANLKSKISLDTTAFSAGMRRVKLTSAATMRAVGNTMRAVGRGLARLGRRAAQFARIAATITFAAAITGAFALGRALKKAFDTGGRLSDLSAQTGVAVKELVILQQAFEDNGVAGDAVGKIINKLQKSIVDFGAGLSTQTRAFDALGITFDRLENKSPLQQFELVQKAIAEMEDPTKRAAAAMDIFGRSGGEMMALFKDGNAISNAAVTVGSQADILHQNATTFDRISDLLGSAGKKLQGFVIGVADMAAPKILEVLERFNAIDFASIGRRFAAGLDLDNTLTLLKAMFDVAARHFGNAIVKVFKELGPVLAQILTDSIFKAANEVGKAIADMWPDGAFFNGALMLGSKPDVSEDEQSELKKGFNLKKESSGDFFGAQSAQTNLRDAFNDILEKGAKKLAGLPSGKSPESDEYESERLAQKRRVAEDMAKMAALALPKDYHAPTPGLVTGPVKPKYIGETASDAQKARTKSIALREGGFSGLAGLAAMQADRAGGVEVGTNSIFAKDRKRLGIASGLSSGGLGASKRVGEAAEEKAKAREDKLVNTNEKLDKSNEILQDQLTALKEGLAV